MSKPKILRLSEEDSAQVSDQRRVLSDTNSKSLPDLNSATSVSYDTVQQFANECEMAEINANSSLQAALKLALEDAKNKQGRIVK